MGEMIAEESAGFETQRTATKRFSDRIIIADYECKRVFWKKKISFKNIREYTTEYAYAERDDNEIANRNGIVGGISIKFAGKTTKELLKDLKNKKVAIGLCRIVGQKEKEYHAYVLPKCEATVFMDDKKTDKSYAAFNILKSEIKNAVYLYVSEGQKTEAEAFERIYELMKGRK